MAGIDDDDVVAQAQRDASDLHADAGLGDQEPGIALERLAPRRQTGVDLQQAEALSCTCHDQRRGSARVPRGPSLWNHPTPCLRRPRARQRRRRASRSRISSIMVMEFHHETRGAFATTHEQSREVTAGEVGLTCVEEHWTPPATPRPQGLRAARRWAVCSRFTARIGRSRPASPPRRHGARPRLMRRPGGSR